MKKGPDKSDLKNPRGARLRSVDGAGKPVDYIRSRLRETEKVINGLKDELNYYREQHSEVSREKNELLKFVSQRQMLKSEQVRLESDFNVVESERDKLREAALELQAENKKLKRACVELEAALTKEQNKHLEAQEVIVYLEAQIEQLESMVEMLKEHTRFMKEE